MKNENTQWVRFKADFRNGNQYTAIVPGQENEIINFERFMIAMKDPDMVMIRNGYYHTEFKIPFKP